MSDKQALYDELAPYLAQPRRGADGRLWAFCPCHPDGAKHQGQADRCLAGRSLYLHPRIGLGCFAGCKFEDIVKSLRNGHGPLPTAPPQGRDRLVALYDYLTPDGSPGGQKGRFEGPDGKRFAWRKPGATEWTGGVKLEELALYGADALPPDKPVYFVEGEKTMEALNEHGCLAVCAGGGSSQTDFGDGLKVLVGRHIYLWPDNDAPGRKYMENLARLLKPIAADVRFITSPIALPVKGDAYDYFALGGTREALEKHLGPAQPVAEVTGEDAVRVTIPTAGGPVSFDFSEIMPSPHRLEAQVTVAYGQDEPYRVRRNLLSGSERTDFRRALENMYGKDIAWERILNIAYNRAQDTWKQQDSSVDVATLPALMRAEEFALMPFLPKLGMTIWFGDGDSCKTYLLDDLMLAHALGLSFLGAQAPDEPLLFLDYEDSEQRFRYRLERLRLGRNLPRLPLNRLHYLAGNGIPLAEQVERIRRKAAKDGIGRLCIDSINVACGGRPEETEVATNFVRATQKIGLPILAIAHINKGDSIGGGPRKPDTHKPFGSNAWHNAARRTFWVNRDQETRGAFVDVAFVCRKANDGVWPHPIAARLEFQDPDGPVHIKRTDMPTVGPIAESSQRLSDRCKQALVSGSRTVAEIVQALGMEDTKTQNEKIRVTLVRGAGKDPPEFIRLGSTWGLPAREF